MARLPNLAVDEDRLIRETYQKLYAEIMETINNPNSRHAELMPKIYDSMVRCNRHVTAT